MKKLVIWMFAFVLLYPSAGYSQPGVEREAVRQAVLDNVEGVYEIAPERIERRVHPDLFKRGFNMKKGEKAYSFAPMTFAVGTALALSSLIGGL